MNRLVFLTQNDIFGVNSPSESNRKYQYEFEILKDHLVKVLNDSQESFKVMLKTEFFFNSPMELISHINTDHCHLPIDIFTDILSQKTKIPTVIKSLRQYFKDGIFGANNLFYNVYRDLTAFQPLDYAFTTDPYCPQKPRNQVFLIYAYVTLALQLQDHNDQPKPRTFSKMKTLYSYLDNFLYVIHQDVFEVAVNNECMTESDRIAFGKMNILKLIVGNMINH